MNLLLGFWTLLSLGSVLKEGWWCWTSPKQKGETLCDDAIFWYMVVLGSGLTRWSEGAHRVGLRPIWGSGRIRVKIALLCGPSWRPARPRPSFWSDVVHYPRGKLLRKTTLILSIFLCELAGKLLLWTLLVLPFMHAIMLQNACTHSSL